CVCTQRTCFHFPTGERHCKCCPFSRTTVDKDFPSVRFDNLIGNPKTQSKAAVMLRRSRSFETLKNSSLIRKSDPDAVVLYDNPRCRTPRLDGDLYWFSTAIFDRIEQ